MMGINKNYKNGLKIKDVNGNNNRKNLIKNNNKRLKRKIDYNRDYGIE